MVRSVLIVLFVLLQSLASQDSSVDLYNAPKNLDSKLLIDLSVQ